MLSLRHLSLPLRALFSCFLAIIGIGYLTAISLLYLVDIEPHQKLGQGIVEGISIQYHGTGSSTRLEAALKGVMADKLSADERDRVILWLHKGAEADGYPSVEPIFTKDCIACHSPASGLPIPSLASYDDVKKLAQTDTGPSIVELARVSHIHLFGISVIFILTGVIFSFSETPIWFRVSFVTIPYIAIVLDIGSWWITKYFDPVFAYVVIIGGGFMGLALAVQILVSLWEMWIGPLKAVVGMAHEGR